ncbi:MAG: hypothetical protein RIC35_03930 [Marinoscillum sp.]
MMKRITFLFVLGLTLACSDETPELTSIEEGTYEGTFTRSSDRQRNQSANVILTFEDGAFTGASDQQKFPAICRGSYEVNTSGILFSDSCIWTADFDWSLILSGQFSIAKDRDNLILTKSREDIIDIYQLTRQ